MRVLDEVLRKIRADNPRAFLMIENCGDVYGSWVWGNLTWNGEQYDEFFNMYKYTFPEYVQVNMVNPRRNLSGLARETQLHADLNRALMLGSVFWLGIDKMASLSYSERAYIDAAVALRARLTPLFADATFADSEGVVACSPGVATAWRFPAASSVLARHRTAMSSAYVVINTSCTGPGSNWLTIRRRSSYALLSIDGTENRLTVGQPASDTVKLQFRVRVCASTEG